MFQNNFKIAWRSLAANPMFSFINIFGLSLGLAIAMVLFLFIRYEQSYDSMYANKEHIHRVLLHTDGDNGQEIWGHVPPALAPALRNDVPNIKSAARAFSHAFGQPASIHVNNENFTEKSFFWVDAELLDIFDLEFIHGQAKSALSRPNTVVLSKSAASKYFGKDNPLGKTIVVDNDKKLEVTGVYKDLPNNSTLDCEVMASFSSTGFDRRQVWGNASFETFVLLNDNTNISFTETQLQQVLDKNVDKQYQWYTFSLQALQRIHLYSADFTDSYFSRVGDIDQIRNLSFVAILIVLIACINYMNLTTARSQKRSKEVGVNKTLGASSKALVQRFYLETALLTAIAIVVAVGWTALGIPLFNKIAGETLHVGLMSNLEFVLTLLLLWLVTSFTAGSYPALYLSGFSPKSILTPSFKQGKSNTQIRKGLVVAQFAASVILIIGVLVIYQQIQHMKNQKLGFEPENVIAISTLAIQDKENRNTLVQEFKAIPQVLHVSLAQGFPGEDVSGNGLSRDSNDEGINIQTNQADGNIIAALKLKLLAGSTLPQEKKKGDTLVEVILNKKGVDYLGFTPDEAIGKKVLANLGDNARIVGVVDNFNFKSLHLPIGAYAFHNKPLNNHSYLLVRFTTNDLATKMNTFENTFTRLAPTASFDYTFLNKNFENLYKREQKIANIGISFCVLAIFVACLGLFGLAAFMAEQRKKEIGIRKVLGANVLGIVRLLSKDFVKLVLIALTIAFPISFWLMDNWLQNFAYRIDIGWSIFFAAGCSALLIALLTISFQAVRAALMNPVKSLRTE